MADWALSRGGIPYRTAGILSSGATHLTAITSGGSSNTIGSAIELTPATDIECGGFWVHWFGGTSDGTRNAIGIWIGAAGVEVRIAGEFLLDTASAPGGKFGGKFWVPIAIPLGSRVSVKHRASGATKDIYVGLTLVGVSPFLPVPFQRCTPYGFLTASTNGTSVIESATPHTKGSPVDLTASSTFPCKALILALFGGGAVATEQRWLYDILAGGVVVVPDIPIVMAPSHDRFMDAVFGPFPVDIAAGVALSLQCQTDSGSSPNNSAVLYGLD